MDRQVCNLRNIQKIVLTIITVMNRFASETPLHRAKASCFVTGGFEDDVIKVWSQQLGGFTKIQNSRKNGTTVGYAITKDDAKDIRMRHALFKVFSSFRLHTCLLTSHRMFPRCLQRPQRRARCLRLRSVLARTRLRQLRKVRGLRVVVEIC